MRWIFRGIVLLMFLLVSATLHYTLPQRDIVIITGTEIVRQDFSRINRLFFAQADSGTAEAENRDLRLINTINENGRVRVYRNEDTGLGWPFYLKFGSADLQAEAQSLISSQADPNWVVVRHYGWRSTWVSIYPNAVSVHSISGPDVRLIPWFNILVLTALFAVVWGVGVRILRFRRRRIDPLIEAAEDRLEDAADDVRGFWGRLFGRNS